MEGETPNPGSTPLPGTRTLYSAVSAENFIQQFQSMMEEHQKATMAAQDALVRQVSEPIVALTSKLERPVGLLDPASRRRS